VAATAPLAYSLSSAQAPLKHNPFTLGVASGSPNHHSVVLWTRLMPDANSGQSYFATSDISVQWEVADDEHFKVNRRSGQVVALATLAHSVHLELEGLQSDRWYFYRFQFQMHRMRQGGQGHHLTGSAIDFEMLVIGHFPLNRNIRRCKV
jgi:phosphodiesterase/alkaline phosphatase D-like protein